MLSKKLLISLVLLMNSLWSDDNILYMINQGVPAIKEMLKEVSVQKRYKKNRTLLHYAVQKRDFELVSFLVKEKILLSARGGDYNNTPLQDSISYGYLRIAHYLIKKGTPLNLKNIYGQTALHIASSRGYDGLVKELLTYGADRTTIDNSGYRAYELIPRLSFGNRKKLKKLLEINSNLTKKKKSYKESIFIDKRSKINNSIIGIQIEEE